MGDYQPYVTIRSRRPADRNSLSSADSTIDSRLLTNQSRRLHSHAGHGQYGSSSGDAPRTATHDVSRVSYHVKHLNSFAKTLEDSASRAFPNRGRSSQRYRNVQALLLHWGSDDLFVLPELEDLERCLREDYAFNTEIFPIPSENSHLELMMQVGKLIKDHEAQDTLFLIYYGGHARIDESRQSTWCATRQPDSPWLQWSAIQTLLERSASDVLILLDCCAGAASATFPNGNSITETISASSWDAIAPDPGRYSFTNALIEVLQEWRMRTFSAAMLHAEVLARLKHPRPITINGKLFEARSTPVHFMMTSNHKAPSIELSRIVPAEQRPPSPPQDAGPSEEEEAPEAAMTGGRGLGAPISGEPNEETPHVMISLALEDNQQLDLNAWEQWLANFPALAKYVKVQGVFKSHSTLLLLSMPVMVWDLLPEDHATTFVAFIRSNNLVAQNGQKDKLQVGVPVRNSRVEPDRTQPGSTTSLTALQRQLITSSPNSSGSVFSRTVIPNQQRSSRRTIFEEIPEPPKFSQHVENLLQQYYQREPRPNDDQKNFMASNLGIDLWHVEAWFHYRREKDVISQQLQNLKIDDLSSSGTSQGTRMILPHHLNRIIETLPLSRIMLVDLRPPTDFERSHIRGAINLRAPLRFVQEASFDMIERALPDQQSRQKFGEWRSTVCMVVYTRAVDHPWDCPVADVLYAKFRSWGWCGRCFVLKGHYREFSVSYSESIAGSKVTTTTDEAARLQGLYQTSMSKDDDAARLLQYEELLTQIDSEEGRFNSWAPKPTASSDRALAISQHEEELDAEFRRRVPDLYRKALDVHGSTSDETPAAGPGAAVRHRLDMSPRSWPIGGNTKDSAAHDFDTKAPLVEFLDRGLSHVRQETLPGACTTTTADAAAAAATAAEDPGLSKLAADSSYFDTVAAATGHSDDSYVEISRRDAQQASDPGPALKGKNGTKDLSTGDETPRRGSGGFLSKVLRRA